MTGCSGGMRDRVEVTLRGIRDSDALQDYIREEARKLDQICNRVQCCRVLAQSSRRPNPQGAQISVGLSLTLPGTEIVVNREHGEDVYIALRDAFEAAGLQLKDYMRRRGKNGRSSFNAEPNPGS